METKAVGQITIIDFNDAISLSGFITSNVGQSVMTTTSLETFTPDFSSTHAVLTPHVFLSNRADVDIMESLNGVKEVVWLKQTNEMDAPGSLDAYEISSGLTNHSRLIIENNPFGDTVTSVTYSLKVTYEDEASYISYMATLFFTFTLTMQGENGEAGASAEAIIEYALVLDGNLISSATWSEILPAFQVGYSYFRRVKTVWSDGREISYSEAVRDDALTNALKSYSTFTFQMSSSTFIKNLRNKSDKTIIEFTPLVSGYGEIKPTFYVDDTPLTSAILELLYTDERLSVSVTMKALYLDEIIVSDTKVIKAIDETVKPFYLGAFEDEPTSAASLSLLEGDWYFSTKAKKTYVYTASGTWKVIEVSDENFASMALSTLPDKFASALNVDDEVLAENIYVKNLISSFVTAQYIAAKDLELLPGGAIRSKDYEKGTVTKLINGEEIPLGTPEKGFHLDTSGDAEFYKASMYEASVNKGTLNDVVVNGELNADTFATLKNQIVSAAHRAVDITLGPSYWAEKDAIEVLNGYAESTELQEFSGALNGISFSRMIFLTESDRTLLRYLLQLENITSNITKSFTTPALKTSITITPKTCTCVASSLNGQISTQTAWYASVNGGSFNEIQNKTTLVCPASSNVVVKSSILSNDAIALIKPVFSKSIAGFNGLAFQNTNTSDTNGRFLFVGKERTIRCSEDFSHVDILINDFDQDPGIVTGIAYGNGRIVILSSCSDGNLIPFTNVSTDGGISYTSYNTKTNCSTDDKWLDLVFVDNYFYAFHYFMGYRENCVVRSSDGINWTDITSSEYITMPVGSFLLRPYIQVGENFYSLEWGTKKDTGDLRYYYFAKTSNLLTYVVVLIGTSAGEPTFRPSLSYTNGRFYCCIDNILRTSVDGRKWTEVYTSPENTGMLTVFPGSNIGAMLVTESSLGIVTSDKMTIDMCTISGTSSCSATYSYSDFEEGWSFIDSNDESIGSISENTQRMMPQSDTLEILSPSSDVLFSSTAAVPYYKMRGLEKLVDGAYVTEKTGIVSKVDQETAPVFQFRKNGDAIATIVEPASIKSITWNESVINVLTDEKTYTINSSDFLSLLNLSFIPVGRARGNYTESIYPEAVESERTDDIDLGSMDNRFNAVYANTLFGEAEKAKCIMDSGDGRTLTMSISKEALANPPAFLAGWSDGELRAFTAALLSVLEAAQMKGFKALSSQGWGEQTGTFVHGEGIDGCDWGFRKNCPVTGQVSLMVDGKFYQNEGRYPCIDSSGGTINGTLYASAVYGAVWN